jgi:hypothetical protein
MLPFVGFVQVRRFVAWNRTAPAQLIGHTHILERSKQRSGARGLSVPQRDYHGHLCRDSDLKEASRSPIPVDAQYPLQGPFSYVLGKQIDEKAVSGNSDLIYESSNGDSWSLTRDPATGARVVMHRPNPQSGGQVSFIEVEKFLSDGTNGPEHQALQRLMEKTAGLRSILIAYDIHPPKVKHTKT